MDDRTLDALTLLSFVISILNYQENLTQSDKQDLLDNINAVTSDAIVRIREHLNYQDKKLNEIMEVIKNESNKKAQ